VSVLTSCGTVCAHDEADNSAAAMGMSAIGEIVFCMVIFQKAGLAA
jgi:uncharacterized protein (DUF983 family)